MKFLLTYDKKNDNDPLDDIVKILALSEVPYLNNPYYTVKSLLSTIEFEYSPLDENKLHEWMNRVTTAIEEHAHVRLIQICADSGKKRDDLTKGFAKVVQKLIDNNEIDPNSHIRNS